MAEDNKKTSVIDEEFMKKRKELFENKEVEDISSSLSGEERKAEAEEVPAYQAESESSIDDINKLLESVGIEPIELDKAKEKKSKKAKEAEKTKHFSAIKKKPEVSSASSTKHFSLGKEEIAFKAEKKPDEKAQLIFEGYEDEDKPSLVSEEEVEKQLQKSRKNLIENFRVLSKNESDKAILEKNYTGAGAESIFDSVEVQKGETLFDAVERAGEKVSLKDKKKALFEAQKKAQKEKRTIEISVAKNLKKYLSERNKSSKRKTVTLLVVLGLTLILNLMASVYTETNNFGGMFKDGARIFTAINLVLLAVSCVVSSGSIKKGIEKIKSAAVDVNACIVVLSCFVLLHGVAMLITGMTAEAGIYSFTMCSVFAMLSVEFAEIVRSKCVNDDISVMLRSKSLMGIHTVENKNEAAAIASGLSKKGEPKLVYPTETDLAENYDEIASSFTAHEKTYSFAGAAAIVAGMVLAVVVSIIKKDVPVFITGFVSCICLCAPFMRHLISVMLKKKNDSTHSVGSVVVASYDCAKEIGKATALIVDTDEVFSAVVSKFKTVPGGRMVRSDAVVYAAATLKNSRSILCDAFDDYLDSVGIILPEAEDLQYEDKLGYSCWVAGRRVLVGNREMLIQHSVVAPSKEQEELYESKHSVMYVAVEGVIAATFVVSYNVKSELKNIFRSINNSGLVLILNTGDPCLDEKLVSSKLSADVSAIKIASSKASRIIERCRRRDASNGKAGLFYSKTQKNALLLFYAAHNLYEAEKYAGIIHLLGLAISFILLAVCIIMKFSSFFAPITIILFQLLWSAVSYFIGSTRIK